MQAHQLAEMQGDLQKWSNQARFIQMIIDGKLVVSKKKKVDLIAELKQKGFKAIPKVVDNAKQGKLEAGSDEEDVETDVTPGANDYDYLLGVSNRSCACTDRPNHAIDADLVIDKGTY